MADAKNPNTESDEDLDKIMKEISTLEEQVSGSEAVKKIENLEQIKAMNNTSTDAVLRPKEVISEPSERTQDKVIGTEQKLSMTLTGNLKLNLSFANGNRGIEISCNDDSFVCRLMDGTEFKIPCNPGHHKIKAA